MRHPKQVYRDRTGVSLKDLNDFGDIGFVICTPKRDETFKFTVITFRIEETNLILLLHQALDQ